MLYRHDARRRCASAQDRKRFLAVLFCGLTATVAAYAQVAVAVPTGTIQGTITDSSGYPVIGVKVWAVRVFAPTAVTAPVEVSADTNANGAYQITGLPGASYRICVSAENAMMLDPCSWSPNPPLSNVQSGQAATVNVALKLGTFVHVRIDDPNGAMASAEQAKSVPAIQLAGSFGTGTRVQFKQVFSNATGRNFRALVPNGATITLQVSSSLAVVDQLGNSVAAAASPLTVQGSTVDQSVRLSVP